MVPAVIGALAVGVGLGFFLGRLGSEGARAPVRCPSCGWVPDGEPRWGCEDCGAQFDTFATRAHCPKCPKSWDWTQCIGCGERSSHVDWYVDGPART